LKLILIARLSIKFATLTLSIDRAPPLATTFYARGWCSSIWAALVKPGNRSCTIA
jgi:hypothetical protein